jgi:hypothetical protein
VHFVDAAAGKFSEQGEQIDLPVRPWQQQHLGTDLAESGDPRDIANGRNDQDSTTA